MKKGLFISFEGTEGAGKSTQLKHLSAFLKSREILQRLTWEPGDSPLGKIIRESLLNPNYSPKPESELFLFLADRAQHVQEILLPELSRNKVVICDRYIDSTLAYQGGGRRLFSWEELKKMNQLCTKGLKPDLTLVFDLPTEEGFRRKHRENPKWSGDRIEKEKLDFHNRVRKALHRIAKEEPKRVKLIDATKSETEVKTEMLKVIQSNLPRPWRMKIFGK